MHIHPDPDDGDEYIGIKRRKLSPENLFGPMLPYTSNYEMVQADYPRFFPPFPRDGTIWQPHATSTGPLGCSPYPTLDLPEPVLGTFSGYSGSETIVANSSSSAELPPSRAIFSTQVAGPSNTPGIAQETNYFTDTSTYSEGHLFANQMVATPAYQMSALNRRRGRNKRLWTCEVCSQTFTAKHNLLSRRKTRILAV
jgi:hypothetical protein